MSVRASLMVGLVLTLLAAVMVPVGAQEEGTAGRLTFARVEKMSEADAVTMIDAASQVAADRATALDKTKGYTALDADGKPVYHWVLVTTVPSLEDGGLIGLIGLQSLKNPARLRWMIGQKGGKTVEYEELKGSEGRKGLTDGGWWQGQCYNQGNPYYQQSQGYCQQSWQGQGGYGLSMGYCPPTKGKWNTGQQQSWTQWGNGCTYIPCGPQQGFNGQQQGWSFQCPPPNWQKGKPNIYKPY
jgi:hypothetical protein